MNDDGIVVATYERYVGESEEVWALGLPTLFEFFHCVEAADTIAWRSRQATALRLV